MKRILLILFLIVLMNLSYSQNNLIVVEDEEVIEAPPSPYYENAQIYDKTFLIPGKPIIYNGKILYKVTEVDKKPLFPGGEAKMNGFIAKHLDQRKEVEKAEKENHRLPNISGLNYVEFIVTNKGELEEIHMKDFNGNKEVASEIIRVMKMMPTPWEPGLKNGVAVNVLYEMQVYASLILNEQ